MPTADGKPQLLIVDDQPENLRMLIEVLKDDYAVIPATGGEAALAKAARGTKPDLILLDIMMPDMDGYEVCQRLKERPELVDVPVIFITAVSEVMDDARAFKLGAVDYITKPFNPATVHARVRTHIQLQQTLRELREALRAVKALSGMLPICCHCKKIRDDKGYWNQLETYIRDHSEVDFSHGICPECYAKLYPHMAQSDTEPDPPRDH